MYKLDLPINPKEQAALDARRRREEERKARFFDAKQRTMGMDYDTLQAQIEEKRQREQREKELDAAYEQDMAHQARIIELLEERKKQDIRNMRKAELEYRSQHQQQHQRREADINDKYALRNERPARDGDDDPRLGPSSLQMMEGEDLGYAERMAAQRRQNKDWIIQQQELKREQAEREEKERQLEELRQKEMALLMEKMALEENQRRNSELNNVQEYNRRMAEEAQRKKQEEKQREMEENYLEQQAAINSRMLSEDGSDAIPANKDTRRKIVPDRFRGMSEEQRLAVLDEQKQQAEEMRLQTRRNKEQQELYDMETILVAKTANLIARQQERERKQQILEQAQENARLAEEQRMRNNTMRSTSKQQADDSFFNQFNKGTR